MKLKNLGATCFHLLTLTGMTSASCGDCEPAKCPQSPNYQFWGLYGAYSSTRVLGSQVISCNSKEEARLWAPHMTSDMDGLAKSFQFYNFTANLLDSIKDKYDDFYNDISNTVQLALEPNIKYFLSELSNREGMFEGADQRMALVKNLKELQVSMSEHLTTLAPALPSSHAKKVEQARDSMEPVFERTRDVFAAGSDKEALCSESSATTGGVFRVQDVASSLLERKVTGTKKQSMRKDDFSPFSKLSNDDKSLFI